MNAGATAKRVIRIPGDIVLEPDEQVLDATKPLAFWLPMAIVIMVLWAAAFYALADASVAVLSVLVSVAVAVTLLAGAGWIRWRSRWFILTDRRVIHRWGVLNRTQTALLLSRLQDVELQRPFPLSLVRGYGVLELETAGQHSDERVSGGSDRLAMERADRFHRRLTAALTPAR